MITSAAVDDSSIESFINRVEDDDRVVRASVSHGRAIDVVVVRDDDGIPTPWADWDDTHLVDGEYHAPEYVISKLAGGGSKPGDKFTRRVGISAYCDVCGAKPQSDDHGLCSTCSVHEGLLTGPAGEVAYIRAVHDEDGAAMATDPGETYIARANDDGILKIDNPNGDSPRDRISLNANAHRVVRWVSNFSDGGDA